MKKMSKKFFMVIIVTVILVMSLSACGGGKSTNNFVGKWESETHNEFLTLFSDGTGAIEHPNAELEVDKSYPITSWAIKDGKLTINYNLSFLGEQIYIADYSISGDSMVLTSDGESTTYTRIE